MNRSLLFRKGTEKAEIQIVLEGQLFTDRNFATMQNTMDARVSQ